MEEEEKVGIMYSAKRPATRSTSVMTKEAKPSVTLIVQIWFQSHLAGQIPSSNCSGQRLSLKSAEGVGRRTYVLQWEGPSLWDRESQGVWNSAGAGSWKHFFPPQQFKHNFLNYLQSLQLKAWNLKCRINTRMYWLLLNYTVKASRKNQSYLCQQLYQKLGEMNIAIKNTGVLLVELLWKARNLESAVILVPVPQLHLLL